MGSMRASNFLPWALTGTGVAAPPGVDGCAGVADAGAADAVGCAGGFAVAGAAA